MVLDWVSARVRRVAASSLALCWLAATALAQPQQIAPQAQRQIAALFAEKVSRTPAQRKMSSRLVHAAKVLRGQPVHPDFPTLPNALRSARVDARNFVEVDITANVTPELLSAIAVMGGAVTHSFKEYNAIRASLPLVAVEQLAARSEVRQVRVAERSHRSRQPAAARSSIAGQLSRYFAATRNGSRGRSGPPQPVGLGGMFRSLGKAFFVGPNTSGDIAHQGPSARSTFGVTGAGVKIGVISGGVTVSVLAVEQAAGRLPADVTVLPGFEGTGDEGAAMMEIIHTLAPGASLYFATGHNGRAAMAAAMQALADAGCKIIVDDVSYSLEGVYQDNEIALKTNQLAASGVIMVTAATNLGNLLKGNSGVWEGDFVNGGPGPGPLAGNGGTVHNFGGGTTWLTITSPSDYDEYHLAWSDPNGASANDYDFFILNSTMTTVIDASTEFQDGTQDPVENIFNETIPVGSRILVGNFLGAAAPRTLFVDTNGGNLSLSTSGSIYGHAAATGAITVAAVNVSTAGGGAFTGGAANPVANYSADGPRRVYYNPDGTPITPGNVLMATNFPRISAGGVVRNKPDFAAADGVPTGVSGYNPFFGTSAAAPHVAALAALLVQSRPGITVAQVRSAFQASALNIEGPGFDITSGHGIAMASAALTWASTNVGGVTITSAPDTGLGFTVTGSGCAPGSYSTPTVLSWSVGALCTVNWLTPVFPIPDLRYLFSVWQDSSNLNPRTFVATGGAMSLTGTFQKAWRLTTQASPGAGGLAAPGTSFFNHGSTITLTPTPNVGFNFSGWLGTGGGSYSGQALNPVVTMTAPVTQTANFVATGNLGLVGSLAQIASAGGEGWKTTMIGVNLGAAASNLRVNFIDDNGNPLTLPLTFPQTPAAPQVSQSAYNTTLNPMAQIVVQSTGPSSSPLLQGWGRLLAAGRVNGYGIFGSPANKWEAVVPLEPRNASRYVLAFDNTGSIVTGLAIANGAGVATLVPVVIRDHTGATIFSGTIPLGANGHTAFMLDQTYPVTDGKRGTIEFQTPPGGQISVLGLRLNATATGQALTTLPVLADVGSAGGSITHMLFDGEWTNSFTLVNTGATSALATLNFFRENGIPLATPLLLPQTGATFTTSSLTRSLAPGASLLIETVGNPSNPVVVGSAELSSTGSVSGFGIFRWRINGQEASVPVDERDTPSYVLVFDNTSGLTTGVAVSSIGVQVLNVTIRDDTGATLLTTTLPLPAHGHTSFVLPSAYPIAAGKRGTIEFTRTGGGRFSVIGLRAAATNLTIIPVMTR